MLHQLESVVISRAQIGLIFYHRIIQYISRYSDAFDYLLDGAFVGWKLLFAAGSHSILLILLV